jgi:hypothetical protein
MAIGILGEGKSAARLLHLTKRKIEDVARGIGIKALVRDLVRLGVNDGKLRLVVKHLFEMRDEPGRTCGVSVRSSAQLIVDAAAFHRAQRVEGHVGGVVLPGASVITKQETQHYRPRKFRCPAKPAVGGVVSRRNLFVGLVKNRGSQITRGRRLFADNFDELPCGECSQ